MNENQKATVFVLRNTFQMEKAISAIRQLANRPADSADLEVVIRRHKSQRSPNQNKLYQVWSRAIAEFTGYPHEELKLELRNMFLPKRQIRFGGCQKEVPVSTTVLNQMQMAEYMTQIEIFAAQELGLTLIRPEDQHYQQWCEELGLTA